jgi:glutaconyl-CoA/methylmalonyl-CoA decarboxylase subunit gamma
VTDTSPASVAGAKAAPKSAPAERQRALAERPSGKISVVAKSGEVRTLMNGLVKELLVKMGDTVTVGQKLAIFEAMKMEQEIIAATAGKVTKLEVKAGDTVEESALLMVISED